VLTNLKEASFAADITSDEKSKLKEIFEQYAGSTASSTIDSGRRKTRKEMPPRSSAKNRQRSHKSASPCMKRRGDEDSGDEVDYIEDFDGTDPNGYEDCSDEENPDDIIENELGDNSLDESAQTAHTAEEGDPNAGVDGIDDLKKYDMKDLIYKLFLNIYNSEKDNTNKLKNEIFPRINEHTQLDNYITYAISNCMDHVKDELQSFIKNHLKSSKKKSMINDAPFVPISENLGKYNELIDKIIDFYELFKCSIDPIVAVWKEKLGHIDRLYEIFDFRHKKLFSVNIWQDKTIVEVIKIFLKISIDDEDYRKRIEELKGIDEDMNENK
jgi:hypothetical protein